MLGFDTFDIMVWARNFVIQNTWAEPNCSNPNLGFILEGGGVFGPDILNHFSNVKYLALAQGHTGLLSHSSAAAKRTDLAAGRVL